MFTEKKKNQTIYHLSVNVGKVIDWFKHRKDSKEITEDDYEWRYEHTNYVCKEPLDRTQPYCSRCGGELVYKLKRRR